eukprot:CAMPEP_0114245954 /NCGR_PEP_ID=MMETSP0058-20121206/12187_1 /TAXON_ID=36894 /ORGANISM="Pyramimonas parkeae, CCMP726" /LENGTH=212 /DNA_ID=CAMNT_0001359073 /DNA_START=188 /DNA_END=826 /DNA_ORIENTATION=-
MMHEGIPMGQPMDPFVPRTPLPEHAHLVARKKLAETTMVSGENLTVTLEIFNTGASAAFNVQVEDSTFPSELYDRVEGEHTVQWAEIGAGANVSHTFVVRPKAAGVLSSGSALVTYKMGVESTDEQMQMWSTPLMAGPILSTQEKYLSMALRMGKYTSLGFLKSKTDWQVFFTISFLLGGLLLLNSAIIRFRKWRKATVSEKLYEELIRKEQ